MSVVAETPMPAVVAAPTLTARLVSLDAYRGFVMVMMASEQLEIPKVLNAVFQSPVVSFVADQLEHREWTAGTISGTNQPSFSFLVGVGSVVSFSHPRRTGEGQTYI